LQRLFDYLDRSIVIGQQFQPFPTCLVAVMTLELAANETFRAAAKGAFSRWLDDLERLMAEAIAASPRAKSLEARSLAEFFLATLEGSLILARAREDRTVLERNVTSFKNHLRRLLS
jgi:TetR/AcrR family transcriptional regulator, transcriptional repressor for nem operon